MKSELLTKLYEQIGAYGVQCSETKELAPTKEMSEAMKNVERQMLYLDAEAASVHESWRIIAEENEKLRKSLKEIREYSEKNRGNGPSYLFDDLEELIRVLPVGRD